jgi:hypothetical protein
MIQKRKKYNKHSIWLAILALLYLVLTYITPIESATLTKYNLSPAKAHFLSLTLAIPIIAIWGAAVYGYIRLSDYAHTIQGSKDGIAWMEVARGLGWLAYGLPLSAVIGSVLNYIAAYHTGFIPASIILTNYLSVFLLLVGMYWLSVGSTKLLNIVHGDHYSVKQIGLGLLLVVITVFFAIATFANDNRQFPSHPPVKAVYYLSDPLIVLTIFLPYLLVWFFGFKAAYNVYQYRKFVPGSIYKKALGLLSSGILVITLTYIFARYLVSVSGFLEQSSLQAILGVLYLLILLLGIGYVLAALGSRRLKQIEEV